MGDRQEPRLVVSTYRTFSNIWVAPNPGGCMLVIAEGGKMGAARDRQASGGLRAGSRGDETVEEPLRPLTLIPPPSAITLLLLASLLSDALAGRAGQQPRMDPDVAAAIQARREGHKADEERILTVALEKAEREAPESARVALLLNNLGALYSGEGRHDEAEKAHERGLEIYTRIYGPDDPRLIPELNNLAGLYAEDKRFGEAEKLYRQALDILTRTPQAAAWQRRMLVNNLAQFYSRQHRYAEAERLIEGELASVEDSVRPENSQQLLQLRRLLALTYQAEGKPEEADQALQELTPPAEGASPRWAGVRAINESERLISLGDLAEERGDLRGAEEYYNQASAGLEGAKDVDSPYALSKALVKLGDVYREQGSDRDAERVFRQALYLEDDYGKHPGSGGLFPLIALQNLYRDQHRLSEINLDFERTLSAQEKDLGAESPRLVLLLNDYASVEQEEGDLERAESLYRRVVEIQERNLSLHDVQLAGALMNYAGVLDALGRKEEATTLRARAEAIRKEAKETASPAAP